MRTIFWVWKYFSLIRTSKERNPLWIDWQWTCISDIVRNWWISKSSINILPRFNRVTRLVHFVWRGYRSITCAWLIHRLVGCETIKLLYPSEFTSSWYVFITTGWKYKMNFRNKKLRQAQRWKFSQRSEFQTKDIQAILRL